MLALETQEEILRQRTNVQEYRFIYDVRPTLSCSETLRPFASGRYFDTLAERDNRLMTRNTLTFDDVVPPQAIKSLPFEGIRLTGGFLVSVTPQPAMTTVQEQTFNHPSIGVLLATRHGALEVLLLLSERQDHLDVISQEVGIGLDELARVVTELCHFGLVAITPEGLAISSQGADLVQRLVRSTEEIKRKHGGLPTQGG